MINNINDNYFKNTDNTQTTENNTTDNNQNLFDITVTNQDSYAFISQTAAPNDEVFQAATDRITGMFRNKALVGGNFSLICKWFRIDLMKSMKFMPKLIALCSKLGAAFDAAKANMENALTAYTTDGLALKNCKTIEEMDNKFYKIEAQLRVADETFHMETTIINSFMLMLPDLNEIIEKNPAAAQEIQGSIEEILDNKNRKHDFSNAENAEQIHKQLDAIIKDFKNGKIQEKIEKIKDRIDEELGRKEKKNFFTAK